MWTSLLPVAFLGYEDCSKAKRKVSFIRVCPRQFSHLMKETQLLHKHYKTFHKSQKLKRQPLKKIYFHTKTAPYLPKTCKHQSGKISKTVQISFQAKSTSLTTPSFKQPCQLEPFMQFGFCNSVIILALTVKTSQCFKDPLQTQLLFI